MKPSWGVLYILGPSVHSILIQNCRLLRRNCVYWRGKNLLWVTVFFCCLQLNWSEIEIILQSLFKCLFLAGRINVWPLNSDWQRAAWSVADSQPYWVLPVVNRTNLVQQKQHPVSYSFFQEPAFSSPATAFFLQVQARKQWCMKRIALHKS